MFYSDNVKDTRQVFYSSWQKYRLNQPLLPLEKQVVEVISAHPEYHSFIEAMISDPNSNFHEIEQTNPFLHMGLHLAITDQITTNRPAGITLIYQQLLVKYKNPSVVEHLMMEPLAACLWEAQTNQQIPNEQQYLSACRQLFVG